MQEPDPYYAVVKDAPIILGEEGCAGGMVQGSRDAARKGALIKLAIKEECA